jgi:peptide deformylase
MPLDVSRLKIVHYPDPVLRKKAAPVAQVTDEVRAVAAQMLRIMREEEGIGLAAPQVGLSWRMFIADVPETEARRADGQPPAATLGPVYYINPVLSGHGGPIEPYEEGCLSLPEIRGDVLRPIGVTISALDLEGKPFTQTGGGLLARCWQHENDHLDGVLIIDKFTQLSRIKMRSAVRDLERDAERRR